jgi:hypothetical protein
MAAGNSGRVSNNATHWFVWDDMAFGGELVQG